MTLAEPIFTYMGQAADGTYPKAGTPIQFRCERCRQLVTAKQPKPGRVAAHCAICVKALLEILG